MSYRDKPRLAAFELLMNVDLREVYANLEMPHLIKAYGLSGRDAAFATELGYGTLRMRGLYDAYIAKISDRPLDKIDLRVLNVLRLGLHQIVTLKTPTHAATSESVDLAKHVAGKSTSGFVNALLRKAIDLHLEDSLGESIADLSMKYSHPEWIVQSYADVLPDHQGLVALLTANNSSTKPDFVAWPGKADRATEVGEAIVGTHFGFTSDLAPVNMPSVNERRVGVQDRGSQLVGEVFLATANISEKKLSWLDMCAGPGGKAAFLYNYLATFRPIDSFTANEISPHRADLVKQVVPAEHVLVSDGQDIKGQFDRILVDAPCTGLGALRRRPESRWRKNLEDLKNLVVLQRELLDSATSLLTDEGIIGYVTCSPHHAETTLQTADFLHRHPDFAILSVEPYIDQNFSSAVTRNGALQLWPHLNNSDAMYMVLLHRKEESR